MTTGEKKVSAIPYVGPVDKNGGAIQLKKRGEFNYYKARDDHKMTNTEAEKYWQITQIVSSMKDTRLNHRHPGRYKDYVDGVNRLEDLKTYLSLVAEGLRVGDEKIMGAFTMQPKDFLKIAKEVLVFDFRNLIARLKNGDGDINDVYKVLDVVLYLNGEKRGAKEFFPEVEDGIAGVHRHIKLISLFVEEMFKSVDEQKEDEIVFLEDFDFSGEELTDITKNIFIKTGKKLLENLHISELLSLLNKTNITAEEIGTTLSFLQVENAKVKVSSVLGKLSQEKMQLPEELRAKVDLLLNELKVLLGINN